MSSILEKLEHNRTPILLAEIGAYLHDLGKARRQFMEHYALDGGSGWDGHNYPSIFSNSLASLLNQIAVEICSEKITLMDFIEKHHAEKENGGRRKLEDIPKLILLLYAPNNGYDGIDSGVDKGSASAKQSKNNIFISSAFGYEPRKNKIESEKADELTEDLYNHVQNALSNYKNNKDIITLRKEIIEGTKVYYLKFLGETRRSANDVTLWDHSYSVATLLKCAAAKIVLDCQNVSFDPLSFDWKILSVNLDVLSILSKGIKIGDIKGYETIINCVFNKVKSIVEEEYPVGNEIYRDTSGIYFLIANINTEELEKKIKEEVYEKVDVIEPMISVNTYDLSGKRSNSLNTSQQDRRELENLKKEELKKILPDARKFALQKIVYPFSSKINSINKFTIFSEGKEICPICRLCPMEENSDGCEYCLKRRNKRAHIWIENPDKTIWLDEVSDHNDRVALIIGLFILDKWLDGTFIKTMAIRSNPLHSKPPSPARIRRVWNTTQEFIKETILENILINHLYGTNSLYRELRDKRIQFTISPSPQVLEGSTVDIDLEGVRFSPVCIDKDNGIFVTTTNLQILSNKGDTINKIISWMNGREIKLKKEGGTWDFSFKIINATFAEEKFQNYLPYIPIYDFPDQFMVLVPAYDALDIASKIFEEYEIQFSKVRDRLPFHIGIIAFHRRNPLYVAMDAGKRLIKAFEKKTETIHAKVDSIKKFSNERLGNCVKKLTIIPEPCYSFNSLIWQISYSTGDPNQQDEWHPYIRIKNKGDNGRNFLFDYDGNGNYVVHVKELKLNDCVEIETSYFKIVFLESAADRFKIDDNLRAIDDIKRLKDLWTDIENIISSKKIGLSQIYAFWEETKRRYKDYKGDEVWEKFVGTSLTNILKISPVEDRELFDKLFESIKDGLLELCLYWNLQVRKVKFQKGG